MNAGIINLVINLGIIRNSEVLTNFDIYIYILLQNENYTIDFSYVFAGIYYIHIHDIHKSL